MADKVEVSGCGIGICEATFIVFLVLKLLGKITWSWWWVTAPLWIPLAILFGILLLVGIIFLIVVIFEYLDERI